MGAAAGGVLGHHVAALLEQACLADGKEGAAADGELPAELCGVQSQIVSDMAVGMERAAAAAWGAGG